MVSIFHLKNCGGAILSGAVLSSKKVGSCIQPSEQKALHPYPQTATSSNQEEILMANESLKGLLDLTTQLPKGLLDVDMDQAIKDLTVDTDSVIDELSFQNSTRAREVSEAYKKTDPKSTGLMSIIPEN